jgi:hypothetical protein
VVEQNRKPSRRARIQRRFKVGLGKARQTVLLLLSSHGRHGQPVLNSSITATSLLFSLILWSRPTASCRAYQISPAVLSVSRHFLCCHERLAFVDIPSFGLLRLEARMYSNAVALVVLIALLVKCEACKWWLQFVPSALLY